MTLFNEKDKMTGKKTLFWAKEIKKEGGWSRMSVKYSEIIHNSYSDQVADVIEEDILNGIYEPGQRITETMLSARFNISRSPLREALQKLEYEGYLEKEPYKGYRVVRATPEEVMNIFVIRANLESLAVYLAVQKQDPDILKRLEDLHEQMKEAAADNDSSRYYDANWRFHLTFHDGCNNRQLQSLLENFFKQTQRYRREYFKTEGQMERSLVSHSTLISYFREGKAEAAEKYRKDTLLRNADILIKKVSGSEEKQSG